MKTKEWIGYILYGILITAVFLYCCFPSDRVRDYIGSVVPANNPGISLSIDSAKPGFPPGVRFTNPVINFKDKPGSTLEADVLTARPAPGSLLLGRLVLLLNADIYEGNMQARVGFADRFSTGDPIKLNVKLDNINIGKCSYLKAVSGRRLDGMLKGSGTYNGKYEGWIDSAGNAEFTLLDGRIQLLKNMFGFDSLVFDRIEANIILKNRILKMNKINLAGKQLSGSFSGKIFLDKNIRQSRLAMKGKVEIPALNQKLSTVLKGTIANPIVRFM